PSKLLSAAGSVYLGNGTASTLTVHTGTVNYPVAATTTISLATNSFVIATSSATANALLNFSTDSTGATSTIGFFVSTTTGLFGLGLGVPSVLQNYIIVGNGKTQAGVGIGFGGLCVDNDGWCSATTTGRVSAVSSTVGNSDVAEMYTSAESLSAGDIVMPVEGNRIGKASAADENKMIGVISTEPGLFLGLSPDESELGGGKYPVALVGRVPVKVTLEGGDINSGDRITLSSIPGVGMRASSSAYSVGIALSSFNSLSSKDETGVGKVLVFVSLGYVPLDSGLASVAQGTTNAWAVDQQSGRVNVNFFGDINLQGNALLDVSRISGYGGKWSISADGSLAVEEVRTVKLCLGSTCIDEDKLKTLLEQAGLMSAVSSGVSSTTPAVLPPEETATSTDSTATSTP
ncbi:hypothetical protein KW797_03705, partial [Candidatus Parcubacteria bacterium]|nr:hypothetical protein [Candidatus Parcubacteria bacterium]